jgi:hypothetical protein
VLIIPAAPTYLLASRRPRNPFAEIPSFPAGAQRTRSGPFLAVPLHAKPFVILIFRVRRRYLAEFAPLLFQDKNLGW